MGFPLTCKELLALSKEKRPVQIELYFTCILEVGPPAPKKSVYGEGGGFSCLLDHIHVHDIFIIFKYLRYFCEYEF